MEDRRLGVSAPSLPILDAHYRHSSVAPTAGSADCFCFFSPRSSSLFGPMDANS